MPTVNPVLVRVGKSLFRAVFPNSGRLEKRHSAYNEECKNTLICLAFALFYPVSGETVRELGMTSQLCGMAPWDTFVQT